MDDPPAGWSPLPHLIRPMLATPGELPTSDEDAWAYEMKWDGVRAVVYVDGGRARVLTRNDREVAATYPELDELAASLGGRQVVLDGEIVAFDDTGRPSFSLLQRRMHVARRADSRRLATSVPVVYLGFDLLHLDGRSLLGLSYDERRAELRELDLEGARWGTPPAFEGRAAEAVATSSAQGLEGVVAKRRTSTYAPGRRSSSWVKVKHVRTQEVVIGGWRPGNGARSGQVGALLVGLPGERGSLTYAGKVGTGFSADVLADLQKRLERLDRTSSPFDGPLPREASGARFVTPRLVGEVAFTEWTPDGRLRHPSWRGLRPDKSVDEVVREQDAGGG